MNRKLFVLAAGMLLMVTTMWAAPVKRMPVVRVQPQGDTLRCFVTGDEFFHRLHDADDFTIMQDVKTGWYVYAEEHEGILVPTQYVAGSVNPAEVGLRPGAMPGREYLRQRHQAWEVPDGYEQPMPTTSGTNHGTLNNIVIFIRFSDESNCTSITPTQMTSKFNDTAANAVSLRSYWRVSSYNKLDVVTHFYPTPSSSTVLSYQDSHSRAYYQPYSATNTMGYNGDSERRSREFTLLQNAVNWVNSNSPVSTTLNIDMDNDGYVDNVCFVVSGTIEDWSELLWPHKWSLYDRYVYINSKRVYTYNFQLAGSGDHYFGVSTLCHEMCHTLGCPDLYHYYNYTNVSVAGYWDLMQSQSTIPQQTNSLFKYKYLNWLDSIPELTDTGNYTLYSLATGANRAYKIASANPHQWYILEYRNDDDRFDSSIPNHGLLIWRYNDLSDADNVNFDIDTPHEMWIFRPGSSNDTTSGMVSAAAFGVNGRTAFNATSDPHPYLCNGRADTTFEITNISISLLQQSVTFTFTPKGHTPCGPVSTFPHLQDFEFGDLDCWTFVSGNTTNDFGQNHGAGINGSQVQAGNYAFHFSSFNQASPANHYEQYLISPQLAHTDTLQLSFYYAKYDSSAENLSVVYSTTTQDTAAFTHTLWTATNMTTDFQQAFVTIPPEATYVAFRYNSQYQYYVYIDEISIIKPCLWVTQYPLVQGFEDHELGCWTFESNSANDIDHGNGAGFYMSEARTGNYCFRFSSYNSASDYNQYLVTPKLSHSFPLQLSFYYKKSTPVGENLRVVFSSTGNDPEDFTQTLWTASNITTSYQQATVQVPANARYVALNYYTHYSYYVFVDDIQLSDPNPHDTTTITLHDTIFVPVTDTVVTWVHDTLTNILHDTIVIWVHDTICGQQSLQPSCGYLKTLIHDTIYLRDTIYCYLRDTIHVTLHDTIWQTLRDTTYLTLHDTIYITDPQGIEQVETDETTLATHGRTLIVGCPRDRVVRVFDAMGRLLYARRQTADESWFELPAAGLYLVQSGTAPARKVVVR